MGTLSGSAGTKRGQAFEDEARQEHWRSRGTDVVPVVPYSMPAHSTVVPVVPVLRLSLSLSNALRVQTSISFFQNLVLTKD